VNVEPLGLAAGEVAGDDFEGLADGVEIVQSLFEAEVVEVVGAAHCARKLANFSYCFRKAGRRNALYGQLQLRFNLIAAVDMERKNGEKTFDGA
jgi:hypothetical protein